MEEKGMGVEIEEQMVLEFDQMGFKHGELTPRAFRRADDKQLVGRVAGPGDADMDTPPIPDTQRRWIENNVFLRVDRFKRGPTAHQADSQQSEPDQGRDSECSCKVTHGGRLRVRYLAS